MDIFEASKSGNFDRVLELLNLDALNLDALNPKYNSTPLLHASYEGRLEIVQLLIKKGANVNALDILNRTALLH